MVSCLSWVEMDGAMSGVSRLGFLPLPLPKTLLASSVPMGTCCGPGQAGFSLGLLLLQMGA